MMGKTDNPNLLGEIIEFSPTEYRVARIALLDTNIQVGEMMHFAIKLSRNDGRTWVQLYNSSTSGANRLTGRVDITGNEASCDFEWKHGSGANDQLWLYMTNNNAEIEIESYELKRI